MIRLNFSRVLRRIGLPRMIEELEDRVLHLRFEKCAVAKNAHPSHCGATPEPHMRTAGQSHSRAGEMRAARSAASTSPS